MNTYSAKIIGGTVVQIIVGTKNWAEASFGGTWVDTDTLVGIGWSWDETNGFRSPKPYPSWVWDTNAWVAPVAMPTDGNVYRWNEGTQAWEDIAFNSGSL